MADRDRHGRYYSFYGHMNWQAQRLGVGCALLAFTFDQATKAFASVFAQRLTERIEVLPFFDLVFVRNKGVSFGMFRAVPWRALTLLGLVFVAVLAVCLWRTKNRLNGSAFGLIIGGALGNVLDRARHGAVTDFLDFYLGANHWPAFNMADVAVVSGVGLLLIGSLRSEERGTAKNTVRRILTWRRLP